MADTVNKTENYEPVSSIKYQNLCRKSQGFTYKTATPNVSKEVKRTEIIRATIKAALMLKVRDPRDIMEYLAARYEEIPFQNFQQKRINMIWDHRRIMRYLNDETRTPKFLAGEIVDMGGKLYRMVPDYCFIDGDSIEVVTLRIGKPDITKKGKRNAEIRDLTLYASVLYARKLGFKRIKASYYFLRKSTDTQNWAECEQSFFGGGGNIVSLTDLYDGRPNDLDQQMEKDLNLLRDGIPEEKVCEEDCKNCSKFDICKYMLAPISIIKDPIVRSADDVKLSDPQDQAVNYDHGIVRINAGAGAGKTMVVAFHIKHLIESGVLPEEICCVTFTNAGAKEMLHRAELYTGSDLSEMTICTFNSLEYDIVKANWQMLGFSREPKVIDDVEKFGIIANLMKKNPIYEWTGKSFLNFTVTGGWQKGALAIVFDVFSAVKRMGGTATAGDVRLECNVGDMPNSALDKVIKLYDLYDAELKKRGLLDFDDQQILAFKVFEMDPHYLENTYHFRHIIVDEFQDSSEDQIELIKLLRKLPTFESLMVVGDDSQAIFGFRNTSPQYIIHFEDYMGEHVDDIFLTDNHRSTPEIIAFANAINDMNKDRVMKTLTATRPHGAPVVVNGFYSKDDEYKYIIAGIKDHIRNGTRPEDIAVIAYTKQELKAIADLLTKEQIPSMFAAPETLIENSRIRALIAFSKVIKDTTDTRDALIAANAVMGGTIMELPEYGVDEAVKKILASAEKIRKCGSLIEKKQLFMEFCESISYGDEALEHFAESVSNKDFDEILAYLSDFELYGENAAYKRVSEYPGVVLVTAHSSKGLEWKVVYNTLSRYQKLERISIAAEEEIRRLLFVSATRARDELYVTGVYAAFGGNAATRVMNGFLEDAFNAVGKPYAPIYVN